jgi:hypothetical protein
LLEILFVVGGSMALRDKLAALASATVTDLKGAPVPVKSLYAPGGAVIMLVRRFG